MLQHLLQQVSALGAPKAAAWKDPVFEFEFQYMYEYYGLLCSYNSYKPSIVRLCADLELPQPMQSVDRHESLIRIESMIVGSNTTWRAVRSNRADMA